MTKKCFGGVNYPFKPMLVDGRNYNIMLAKTDSSFTSRLVVYSDANSDFFFSFLLKRHFLFNAENLFCCFFMETVIPYHSKVWGKYDQSINPSIHQSINPFIEQA